MRITHTYTHSETHENTELETVIYKKNSSKRCPNKEIRDKNSTILLSSFCTDCLQLGVGPALKFIHPVSLHWRKRFPLQVVVS